MQTVTLEEAQANLAELIRALPVEREIGITRGDQMVAKIMATTSTSGPGNSVFDIQPISVGKVLRPYPNSDDDILGEMLERE
jgi:antitoxin (DNA-binding transcriptional repressor) of toxin-antitoxin stability system